MQDISSTRSIFQFAEPTHPPTKRCPVNRLTEFSVLQYIIDSLKMCVRNTHDILHLNRLKRPIRAMNFHELIISLKQIFLCVFRSGYRKFICSQTCFNNDKSGLLRHTSSSCSSSSSSESLWSEGMLMMRCRRSRREQSQCA